MSLLSPPPHLPHLSVSIYLCYSHGPLSPLVDAIFQRARRNTLSSSQLSEIRRGTASRATGSLHHFTVIAVGLTIVSQDPTAWKVNPFLYETQLSDDLLMFSSGFFVYDIYQCVRDWYIHNDAFEFVFHGLVCGTLYGLAYMSSYWHLYAACFLLWEASTPFLQTLWFMKELGLRDHVLYKLNGLALALSFAVARMGWGTFAAIHLLWSISDSLQGKLANPAPWWFNRLVQVGMPSLYLLNCVWFLKIVKGLFKAVVKNDTSSDISAKTTKIDTKETRKKTH